MASYQYVYVMKNLTKAYPGGKEIMKGLTPQLPARCQDRRAGRQRRR